MDKNNDIFLDIIDERVEAFARGTMTEKEEAAFKEQINADPELRNHVLATVSLIKGIRKQRAKEESNLIQNNTKSRTRSIMLWGCSIAALFIIFFGYQNEKKYRELSAIISPYYTEYSMSEYSRGDLDSLTVAHLYTLFNNIQKQRDMSDIIKELEPIYASLEADFTYTLFANDIAMNLAFAYIKDNQKEKAIAVLEKLEKENQDTPIAHKAQEIINKLK